MDRQKLIKFFEENEYGKWRIGEKVSYEILDPAKTEPVTFFGQEIPGEPVKINVDGVSFTVRVIKPEEDAPHKGAHPFVICMHPIQPVDTFKKAGFGLIFMDTREIASDDYKHDGCFYKLYPYGEEKEQTGVLMAWAWGAAKVLDAVKAGLGAELGFDPELAVVTGVSRWGKATAVCGAFDHRFKMVVPTCSGAGGLALYGVKSQGKTYDLTEVDAPADYTYGENEPLSCLQSDAERGWFVDKFLQYKTEEEIPVNQEMLAALVMDPEVYYFIVCAATGEDWVNAPAMWECYNRALPYYEEAGLDRHFAIHVHKVGHAVTDEDAELIVKYFDSDIFSSRHDFLCRSQNLYMEK
ncbi:hypothetical protein SAMN02910339_02007 [Lachnospiraceae bacterium YSD2013]|nr:hypothetical protein SAMN02910339_02007 [Lachnospiraceae bacterium YSD2013]